MKRLLDVWLSLALLVALWPLIMVIIVLIWMQGDGPVVYLSPRIGRNGLPFMMYKFRTMVADADQLRCTLLTRNERDAVLFKMSTDPRVTRMGRILRKYSLDEIPQLINVLRGEMSLVGPRPALVCEFDQYGPNRFVRLAVRPGVTGLWQVKARRSPSFHEYIALDLAYVQNRSLWLDFKILWETIPAVLAGTGV